VKNLTVENAYIYQRDNKQYSHAGVLGPYFGGPEFSNCSIIDSTVDVSNTSYDVLAGSVCGFYGCDQSSGSVMKDIRVSGCTVTGATKSAVAGFMYASGVGPEWTENIYVTDTTATTTASGEDAAAFMAQLGCDIGVIGKVRNVFVNATADSVDGHVAGFGFPSGNPNNGHLGWELENIGIAGVTADDSIHSGPFFRHKQRPSVKVKNCYYDKTIANGDFITGNNNSSGDVTSNVVTCLDSDTPSFIQCGVTTDCTFVIEDGAQAGSYSIVSVDSDDQITITGTTGDATAFNFRVDGDSNIPGHLQGLTTAEMKKFFNYTGWQFNCKRPLSGEQGLRGRVWSIDGTTNDGYPFLGDNLMLMDGDKTPQ